MKRFPSLVLIAAIASMAQMPPVPELARAALDAAMGAKGTYVSEESAHRFSFPRSDIDIRVGAQRLSPEQAPASWATFAPSMRREGLVSGELIVLADEADPTISIALKVGLNVTGLGPAHLSSQPPLFALNVNVEGTYTELGAAFRKILDEVRRVRWEKGKTADSPHVLSAPVKNSVDSGPLNTILSMRGVALDGVYRASIGRLAMLNGTPVGREVGLSTKVCISGTNQQGFLDADIITTDDALQRVLLAIRTRNLNINAIRNHFTGEHPQMFFVRVSGRGAAAELARAIRYILDVDVAAKS